MSGESAFIDTNIFIYTKRTDDIIKQNISRKVIDTFSCVVSTQVLNEVSNIFTKKYPLPIEEVEEIVDAILQICDIEFIFEETVKKALQLMKKYSFSYFDSLMLASALNHNCKYIFTEDMNDGQIIDGTLKIINVFEHTELFL